MNTTFDQLLAVLDKEIAAYRTMQTILVQEKEAASLSDRQRLVDVGQQKQDWVDELGRMEAERRRLVDALAREKGIAVRPITISLLIPELDLSSAGILNARRKALTSLMKSVQSANTANSQLITHYLGLIHGALKLLNGMVYDHFVYPRPGGTNRTAGYAGSCGNVFCEDI